MQTSTITQTRTHRTRTSPHPISPIRSTCRTLSDDPFRSRFGHQLPPGLREEARGMQWRTFTATYSPASSLRIHNIESQRLRAGRFHYTATLTSTDAGCRRSENKDIIAMGPISACTNLLADAGRRVEILEFHQYEVFEATVIFIRTCDHSVPLLSAFTANLRRRIERHIQLARAYKPRNDRTCMRSWGSTPVTRFRINNGPPCGQGTQCACFQGGPVHPGFFSPEIILKLLRINPSG